MYNNLGCTSEYNILCLSNLRIESNFPSQGYVDVPVIMFYQQIKQAKQPTNFVYWVYHITEKAELKTSSLLINDMSETGRRLLWPAEI